jgi:hypothetical protein
MVLSFSEYKNLPKGRIAKHDYKSPKSPSQKTTRRRTPLLTNRKKSKTPKASPKLAQTKMKSGKHYYIEDSRGRDDRKTVFKGKYSHIRDDGYLMFDDVEFIVNPYDRAGIPHGFNFSGHRFVEVSRHSPSSKKESASS